MQTNNLGKGYRLGRTELAEVFEHYVGAVGCYGVYVLRNEVVVLDHSRKIRAGKLPTVMEINTYTCRRNGIKYRVMNYTKTDSRYQGAGIAHHIYALVAEKTGPIMSGSSQSPGARSLWNRLAATRFVAALWKGEIYPVEYSEYSEVECAEFEVYENACRLVAA